MTIRNKAGIGRNLQYLFQNFYDRSCVVTRIFFPLQSIPTCERVQLMDQRRYFISVPLCPATSSIVDVGMLRANSSMPNKIHSPLSDSGWRKCLQTTRNLTDGKSRCTALDKKKNCFNIFKSRYCISGTILESVNIYNFCLYLTIL